MWQFSHVIHKPSYGTEWLNCYNRLRQLMKPAYPFSWESCLFRMEMDRRTRAEMVRHPREAGSTWNLTGDCTISSLTNNGTINFNGYTIALADGTVLS